jgi:hypothetical protein
MVCEQTSPRWRSSDIRLASVLGKECTSPQRINYNDPGAGRIREKKNSGSRNDPSKYPPTVETWPWHHSVLLCSSMKSPFCPTMDPYLVEES